MAAHKAKGAPPPNAVRFDYVNHEGARGTRNVVPRRMYFGSTPYHPERQWLLEAWDVDKRAYRVFALGMCNFRTGVL